MSTIDRSRRDAGGGTITLTLTLTDPQRDFLEAEAARAGHPGPADYVRSLIEKERERAEDAGLIESLRDALEGSATRMTPEAWDEIEREAHRRLDENGRP